MPQPSFPGARPFFPRGGPITLGSMAQASHGCQGCDLYRIGTQTVFGEGLPTASLMFVGEQPGDEEDLAGKPFIGPAGRLLNRALEQAGIDRSDAYVTNVVKHFKWEPQGKRRLHKKPGAREITACLPWLEAELALVKPRVLVLLGSTAAQALLGKEFRVTQQRGIPVASRWCPNTVATVHPSSILRSDNREADMEQFVSDLRAIASL